MKLLTCLITFCFITVSFSQRKTIKVKKQLLNTNDSVNSSSYIKPFFRAKGFFWSVGFRYDYNKTEKMIEVPSADLGFYIEKNRYCFRFSSRFSCSMEDKITLNSGYLINVTHDSFGFLKWNRALVEFNQNFNLMNKTNEKRYLIGVGRKLSKYRHDRKHQYDIELYGGISESSNKINATVNVRLVYMPRSWSGGFCKKTIRPKF